MRHAAIHDGNLAEGGEAMQGNYLVILPHIVSMKKQ
jgi:hypothetical protein